MDARTTERLMDETDDELLVELAGEDEEPGGPLRVWGELARLPNLPTVWSNLIAAWILAGGSWSMKPLWLLVGGSLLYFFGTALNDALDLKFDREKRPERPLPSGRVSPTALWIAIVGSGIAGTVITILWGGGHVVWVLTLVATIIAYDAIHKHWAGSCVLMGACRWLLYFVAASAAQDDMAFTARNIVWATVLDRYIIGLTYYARGEADPEPPSVVRWPLLFLFGPEFAWGAGVLLFEHPAESFLFVLLFLAWRIFAILELKRSQEDGRIGRFVGRLLAGIILLDAIVVGTIAFWPAVILLGLFPLAFLLQREFEAT